MSVPAVRSAFTCARCRSHGLLRRDLLALSRPNPWSGPQRRLASSEVDVDNSEQSSGRTNDRQYDWRIISPHGKVVGRRGRRQRQRTEPLKIKSLDQDSEVIVLRDIAEEPYEAREEKEPPSDDEADKPATSVTGQDTENLLVKGTTPKESELFAAIEQHRPKEQDINLKQWREKQRGLANAHNAPQLRQYLRKHQIQEKTPTVARKSKTPAMKTIDQSKLDNTHILVTPWFKTVTNSKTALPLEAEQLVSAKRVSNKQDLVDQIFRTVWKARPVEELDAKGELEIILQPNQWKLLQTRDATNLFRVLRKGVFYQRVKLDHDSLRGALRVYGPQEEAESFAQLVKEAFQSSVHRRISVAELTGILSCSADQALQKFTRTQLKRLEEMTRTVISANLSKQSVCALNGYFLTTNRI